MSRILCLSIYLSFFISSALFATSDRTMRLVLLKSPKTLSYFNYLSLTDWYVHSNITGTLVNLDYENQIVSGLARTWKVEDEGRRYVFELDKNQFWSDGSPITLQEILQSFRNKKQLGSAKYFKKILANREDTIYLRDNALVFELKAPDSKFLYHLSRPKFGIFDVGGLKNENLLSVRNRTSGPYKVSKITEKVLVLTVNPYSKEVRAQNPQKIIFHHVSDEKETLKMLQRGEIDFLQLNSEEMRKAASRSGFYEIVEGGLDNLATMQARRVSNSELKALQVLNRFLDRSLFKAPTRRNAERFFAMSEVPLTKYRKPMSLEEARQMIGKKKIQLTMIIGDETTSDQLEDARLIQREAARIGIHIKLSQIQGNLRTAFENENYQLVMARLGVYAYDEVEFLNGTFCEGYKPFRTFKNLLCGDVTSALEKGVTDLERKQWLERIYQKLDSSGKIIALYHFPRKFAMRQKWDMRKWNVLFPFPIFTGFFVRSNQK